MALVPRKDLQKLQVVEELRLDLGRREVVVGLLTFDRTLAVQAEYGRTLRLSF